MNIFLDYTFYKNKYFGEIDELNFNKKVIHATKLFDNFTHNRVIDRINIKNSFKYCICELIDELEFENLGGEISSESDGVTSVSYVVGVTTAKTHEQRIYSILKKWLSEEYDLIYIGSR